MANPTQFTNLRGGVNETDPPSLLPDDQVVVADNVEFRRSSCGEKRRGTVNVTLAVIDAGLQWTPFLFRHIPSADETAAELWAMYTPTDGSQAYALHRKTTTWSAITPSDDIDVTSGFSFRLSAASLHGKMFLAYRSLNGADRLHVWDGTSLRRTGLPTPAAGPVVVDTGSGTFTGTRYYRTRWAVLSGSTVLRRSEPSDTTTFDPSGTGASARITKPTGSSPAEGETHWEVEASINNADFYRIATVAVGTTTYDDSISAYTVGYAANGTLSDDAGDNTPPWSPKFVTTDQDRLIIAGAWETASYASRVGWTPVTLDPGAGNDERIPIDTNNSVDLDGLDGGGLTGISAAINGYLFAFKTSRIYKGTRTGGRSQAYDWICLTQQRGALPGSVKEGLDAAGNPCIYFADAKVGPCRIGTGGIMTCGEDLRLLTWASINRTATLPIHGIYWADQHQLHYWIATGSATTPNKKIVLHTNHARDFADGVRKGWVTCSEGNSIFAVSSCLFSDNIDDNTTRSLNLVPFIGVGETGGDRHLIQRCDTGFLDRGATYTAYVRTRPIFNGGMLAKFGSLVGMVLAKAASGVAMAVKVIRDFGIEDVTSADLSLTPLGTESQVMRYVDNLSQAEMLAMQVEFGDLNNDGGLWEVNSIVIGQRDEELLTGGER